MNFVELMQYTSHFQEWSQSPGKGQDCSGREHSKKRESGRPLKVLGIIPAIISSHDVSYCAIVIWENEIKIVKK